MSRFWFFIFLLWLTSCSSHYHLARVDQKNVRFEQKSNQVNSSHIDSIIAPYKMKLDKKMNIVIGEAGMNLTKERVESTLGNWVADALVHQAELADLGPIDFAAQNYGGLRIPGIPEGPISIGKIYELMPFDNNLVILEAKGDIVLKLMERIAEYGGWPISKDVRMTIEGDQLGQVSINGMPVDLNKAYRFVLPDYIAEGGDNCNFLAVIPFDKTGILIRDALISEVRFQTKQGEKIMAKKESRIIKK